jgi:hypothetical protein
MTRYIFKITLAAVTLFLLASPLLAQNLKLSGPHFNLNIIGVEKGKTADMRNSDRHTIFVPLNNSDGIGTKIYLVPGSCYDPAYGYGLDACATGKTVRVALFSGGLIDWFWNYYDQGLRLAQIRFYLQ